MFEILIQNFVSKLTLSDISSYKKNFNIPLSIDEEKFIYYFLKDNWKKLFQNDLNTWSIVSDNINQEAYKKITSLYNEAKVKYKF